MSAVWEVAFQYTTDPNVTNLKSDTEFRFNFCRSSFHLGGDTGGFQWKVSTDQADKEHRDNRDTQVHQRSNVG